MTLIHRHPGYVVLATVTLAVSVGVNLVVFTIMNALWLKPLPIRDPDRLVIVTSDSGGPGEPVAFESLVGPRWGAFEAVAGQVITSGSAIGLRPRVVFDRIGREVETLGVSSEYFRLFGLDVRGRDFRPHDDSPGAEPVAIISDRLWREWGHRPDLIGEVVEAKPFPIRIIGVAPPEFRGARRGESVDAWVPSKLVPRIAPGSGSAGVPLLVFARLHSGQTPLDAQRRLLQSATEERSPWLMAKVAVVRLNDVYGTPESRTIIIREVGPLSVVAGLAALVLFGGCVTLMALVLVHYERRRRELAVRIALGASRQRLARALFGELALLAVGGAVGSALVATWSLHIIPSLTLPGSVDLGRLDLSLDWRVLVVAVAVTLLTMLGAALLPVGRFTHASLARELVTGPAATATATSQRTRQVLLALHVCATIVVLVAAGLFVRAVSRGFGNTPGFDTDRTLFVTVQILAPNRKIGQMDAELKVMRERTSRVAEALRSLAGVNVLAEGISPIGANQASALLVPYIIQSGHERRELLLGQMAGSPELLAALGVPILAGRALSSTDATTNPRPAVVTASLARMLWPTEDPLGQIVSLQGRSGRYAIVGIARDFVFGSFSRPAAGVLVTSERAGVGGIEPQFAVRADHPDEVVDSIRKVVSEVLPDAPWLKVETGSSIIARDLGRQRLGAWFFSGFGLTALILSVCGIFGLVSYLTESHRREFGVRLALGATPRCLMRHALRAAMVPVSIGLTAGLLLSALTGRVFASLLAGVSPVDLVTYAAVAFMMLGCAVVAGVSGAWRLQYALPGESLRTD